MVNFFFLVSPGFFEVFSLILIVRIRIHIWNKDPDPQSCWIRIQYMLSLPPPLWLVRFNTVGSVRDLVGSGSGSFRPNPTPKFLKKMFRFLKSFYNFCVKLQYM